MKKLFCVILIILFCIPLYSCRKRNYKTDEYSLYLRYDENENILRVQSSVYVCNKYKEDLNELWFNLYADYYNENNNAVTQSNYDKAYYKGESYSKVSIISVKSRNGGLDYSLENGLLKVSLDEKYGLGEVIFLCMEYSVKLPEINNRFGKTEKGIVNLCGFYPTVCRWENKKFVAEEFSAFGDCFYTEVGNYDVKITLSGKYVVASSGVPESVEVNDEVTTYEFSGNNLRDFALCFSENFSVAKQEKDGVNVSYYYYDDENFGNTLDLITDSVEYFGKLLGKYPYSTYSVCQTELIGQGMEFSTLSFISDTEILHTAVHETAHQWFYGVVGVDQIKNAFIDEGLAEYLTLKFFENNKKYPYDVQKYLDDAVYSYRGAKNFYENLYGKKLTLNRKLSQFHGEYDYVNSEYLGSLIMFYTLNKVIGDKKFDKCLREFYCNNAYKIVGERELKKAFAVKGANAVINSFLSGNAII